MRSTKRDTASEWLYIRSPSIDCLLGTHARRAAETSIGLVECYDVACSAGDRIVDIVDPVVCVIGSVRPETGDEIHRTGEFGWHGGIPVPSPADLRAAAIEMLDQVDIVEGNTSFSRESDVGEVSQENDRRMHDGIHDEYTMIGVSVSRRTKN